MSVKIFSADYLESLVREAEMSPRKRQHRNIHLNYTEHCQRLFNAIEPDSYLRPHCHSSDQGPETIIAVRGQMKYLVFDDQGKLTKVIPFGAGQPDLPVGVEAEPGIWHTVIALESGAIILEVKAGPFDPAAPKFPAPWAPGEGSIEGFKYHQKLVEAIKLW